MTLKLIQSHGGGGPTAAAPIVSLSGETVAATSAFHLHPKAIVSPAIRFTSSDK